jgi:hypothetical protein
VAGVFSDAISFDGANHTATGKAGFAAGFTSAGAVRWSLRLGAAASAVAQDLGGGVLVAGEFSGSASFGGTPHLSAGAEDLFLASYTENGGFRWSVARGGAASDRALAIAVGPGAIYVAGRYTPAGEILPSAYLLKLIP